MRATVTLSTIAMVAALSAIVAPRAGAQRISAGVDWAFADYSEQGSTLRFGGSGVAGHASIGWRRFGLHVSAARLAFEPDAASDAEEPFDLVQTDIRLRVQATGLAALEAGYVQRQVTPVYAAQSVGAVRVGALLAFPLAPGSEVAVRTAYLGGSSFSGGGSAPFGVEIGMGASYAPWSGRVRLTGDLEFQRFDRRTSTAGGRLDAPIQSSTARIGVTIVR